MGLFYSMFSFTMILTLLTACSSSEEMPADNKPDTISPNTIAVPPQGIYSDKQLISLSCSDNKSGCDISKIFYSTDPSADIDNFIFYDINSNIEIAESSTLRFYAIDYEGNVEALKTQKYIIDYAPEVINSTISFTISDYILSIRWDLAKDGISQATELKYKLFYSEHNLLTSADTTLSIGKSEITKGWHADTIEHFDTRLLPETKTYFWQVLVKDKFGNISAYSTSQYSASTANIPQVIIVSPLSADLLAVFKRTPSQISAFLTVDDSERQSMTPSFDINNSRANIVLTDLPPITHNFIVTYEFAPLNSSNGPFLLAQGELSHDFINGQTKLVLPEANLRFSFDEDKDFANNIAEVLNGSNPFSFRWTWVSGTNTTNSLGAYGEKGFSAPSNLAPSRSNSVTWNDSGGNFWLFGGKSQNGFDMLNDLWRWDGSNWTWVSGTNIVSNFGVYGIKGVIDVSSTPGARQNAVSWTGINDNLWLFGGYGVADESNTIRGYFNDLWRWDGFNWVWESGKSVTNANGVYGDKGVANANNVPGARSDSISWVDSNGILWLFGGQSQNQTSLATEFFNDLWSWDGTSWTWVSGNSLPNLIGLYGQKGSPGSNNMPGARSRAISWIDSYNNLWMFGGYGWDDGTTMNVGYLNDLWRWDGSNWTWISGSSVTREAGNYGTFRVAELGNVPGARADSVFWKDSSGSFWLYGGSNNSIYQLNDLWRWDGGTWTWMLGSNLQNESIKYGTLGIANFNNTPGARKDAISWIDGKDNLWLFGGARTEPSTSFSYMDYYLNDLWKIEL